MLAQKLRTLDEGKCSLTLNNLRQKKIVQKYNANNRVLVAFEKKNRTATTAIASM